jgi:polyphosphate kinase 2 (PPK2 family)
LAKSKKKPVVQEARENNVPQKLTRKEFEKELYKLQVELMRLQTWALAEGARVIIVFEGRDTAGKVAS